MNKNRITLLGTGTCQIELNRMASSVLIELGDLKVVFDMGRGISQRLVELGLKNDDIRNIVFSHFHPDHISDLIPFMQAGAWSRVDPRQFDLHIWGPKGVKVQVSRLLGLFEVDNITREHYDVHIHEVRSDSFTINRQEFEFISLPPAGNHGLRFKSNGKVYAITGDSNFHQEEINFLKDTDLAIIDSGHLTDQEIIQLAAGSQAKTIVCSHMYRELDADSLNAAARGQGYTGNFIIGRDLMSFDI